MEAESFRLLVYLCCRLCPVRSLSVYVLQTLSRQSRFPARRLTNGTFVVAVACNVVARIIILDNSCACAKVETVAVEVVDEPGPPSSISP